jgi:hypothetical protein
VEDFPTFRKREVVEQRGTFELVYCGDSSISEGPCKNFAFGAGLVRCHRPQGCSNICPECQRPFGGPSPRRGSGAAGENHKISCNRPLPRASCFRSSEQASRRQRPEIRDQRPCGPASSGQDRASTPSSHNRSRGMRPHVCFVGTCIALRANRRVNMKVNPDREDYEAVAHEYGALPSDAPNSQVAQHYRLAQAHKLICVYGPPQPDAPKGRIRRKS